MSKSGKSLFYFGWYVLLTGILLLIIPNTFIETLKLPDIATGWARIIGLLVIIIGVYDILNGRNNVKPLIIASVYVRFFFAAGVAVLFFSGETTKEVLPLGAIDALGAVWTIIALRSGK